MSVKVYAQLVNYKNSRVTSFLTLRGKENSTVVQPADSSNKCKLFALEYAASGCFSYSIVILSSSFQYGYLSIYIFLSSKDPY